jgi:hypothetical protein
LSFGDRVDVEIRNGELYFKGLAHRGGHRTYRIIMPRKFDAAAKASFESHWAPLHELGCRYESSGAPRNLFAVDVPPEVDFRQVEQLLDVGVKDSTWDYERASPPP